MTIVEQNRLEIESIVLTEQEYKEALFEGKKKKYFKEKHSGYWIELENLKTGKIKQL